MSNGEVRRWETISIDSKITGTWLDVDGLPRIVVLSASDHERIVAELKAEINGLNERLDVFRNREYEERNIEELKAEVEVLKSKNRIIGPATTDCVIEELHESISKQAKVIEKIKELLSDITKSAGVVCCDIRDAIERAEGEKE